MSNDKLLFTNMTVTEYEREKMGCVSCSAIQYNESSQKEMKVF